MPLGGLSFGQNVINRRLNRLDRPQPAVTQPTFQTQTPVRPTVPQRPTAPAVTRPPAPVLNDNFRQNVLAALLQRARPVGGEGPFTPESFRGASAQFGVPRAGISRPQGFGGNNLGRLLLSTLQRRRLNATQNRLF